MDEQKRLILAIVLSVIVLIGYQVFFVKPPDPATQQGQQSQNQKTDPSQTSEPSPNVSEYKAAQRIQPQTVMPPKKQFRTIEVSTPLYNAFISEQGATIRSLELKQYKEINTADSPLKQVVPAQVTAGSLFFEMENQSVPDLKEAIYTADVQESAISVNQGEKSIEFVYASPQGVMVKKILTFKADSYAFDCDIVVQNGSSMPVNDALVITATGHYNEEIKKRSRFAFEGPIALINNEYTTIKPDDIKEQSSYQGNIGWAGFTQRYFMTVIMPKRQSETVEDSRIKLAWSDEQISTGYVQKLDRIDPGQQGSYGFTFYMGPKSLKVLNQYDNTLKEAINFGFFNIIAKPLLIGMNMIHSVIPNYGIAIILLTIIIKLVFWPLGSKSYKSMNEMKKVQPLMMEIREKYKGDKQRMNQEIMGLYKTYKVNPASGCLPLLVQMPIFFALYRMLYQAIELRHAPFVGWVSDLSAPDRLFHFDFAIPMMQAPYGIPMLTLFMGASFLLQQKMTPTAGDPMQAKMMMLMPIFMTVLFINFPAGLVLYMFVNNIISMGQQYYIQKKLS